METVELYLTKREIEILVTLLDKELTSLDESVIAVEVEIAELEDLAIALSDMIEDD